MSRPVVPINQLARRIPTAGRIRIGVKTNDPKRPMKTIDTFRFTSQDRTSIEQIAALYGGSPKPWSDPKAAKGQFEVITETNVIPVALPPDPLGGSPVYELWSGGGCQRRCDGETCSMLVQGSDGIEAQECDCICWAKGVRECGLITRLSVLLPEIRFVGVWRIDTKSDNAAKELPGMVDLIRSLQERGIVRALLRIEDRVQVTAGETHRFKVPVLGLDESVNELVAGMAQLGALGTVDTPAGELTSGLPEGEDCAAVQSDAVPSGVPPSVTSPSGTDDDIVDAEIVGDGRTLADVLPEGVSESQALAVARKLAASFGLDKPTDLHQVTDYRLQAKVLDELGCLEATA